MMLSFEGAGGTGPSYGPANLTEQPRLCLGGSWMGGCSVHAAQIAADDDAATMMSNGLRA